MTPADLDAALVRIGWSRRELARRLGYASEASIRQWRRRVPDAVAAWLLSVVTAVEAQAPPAR